MIWQLQNFLLFLWITTAFTQDTEPIKEYIYSIRSRAYFNEVLVDEYTVMIQTNESLTTFDIPEGLWSDLTEISSRLDLNMLKELETDSINWTKDFSLRGKLRIQAGKTTFYSPDFPRGSPPEEIAQIVSLMEKFLVSE